MTLIGNCLRSARLEHQRMLDKLGKPVDRDEWAHDATNGQCLLQSGSE